MNTVLAPTAKIAGITDVTHPSAGTKSGEITLSMGDTVEATVMQALPGNKYLVNIKNTSLLADSQVQLTAGERITVQVEKMTPGLLLRLTSSTQGETALINKYLLLHRSNPAALGDIFSKMGEMLENADSLPPSLTMVRTNLEKISQLAGKILISEINRTYVNSLTDYAKNLGLNMEHGLVKLLAQGTKLSQSDDQTTVKGLFMGILNDLNLFMNEVSDIDDALLSQLKQFRSFAEDSLSSLETNQVINVLSRESDGPYILQLPFAFPEGVRMQNIYIEQDRGQEKEEGEAASFRMTIFLDLDQIGEMNLDVRFHGKRIDCVFHCQNNEISNFVGDYLEELKGKLEGAGYDPGGLQCLVEENVHVIRQEYLSRQPFNNRLALNLFA